MEKFNFDWNYIDTCMPQITISKTNIGCNKKAIDLLEKPQKVVIGFDEKNLAIGIKAYNGIDKVHTYDFARRVTNGWVRMGCKGFIKYLSNYGLDFEKAKKFNAKYLSEEKIGKFF